MPIASVEVAAGAEPNSEAFWDLVTLIFSSAPRLQASNVMGYSYISPSFPYNGSIAGGFLGGFLLPNGTVEELQEATAFLRDAVAAIPGVEASYIPTQLPNLWSWYEAAKNEAAIGQNRAIGNRLLDAKALSNLTALRGAMQKATPSGTLANLNLVSGPGLRNAVPAGGSDSVTPAWREAYVEYGTSSFVARRAQCISTTANDVQLFLSDGHSSTRLPKQFRPIFSRMCTWRLSESWPRILAAI